LSSKTNVILKEIRMVEIIKEDIKPKCPHCEKEVDKLVEVKRKGWFVLNRVY